MAFIRRARYRRGSRGVFIRSIRAEDDPTPKEDSLIKEPAIRASTVAALAAVRRLSFAALHAATDAEIHCELASELFRAFSVEQVHVSRLAQDRTLARGTVYQPAPDGVSVRDEWVLPLDRPSAVREVARTGEPFNEPDARNAPLMSKQMVERFKVASALFVPLIFEGEVRNVVVLVSETPQRFSEEEVQLVHTLANQASAALAVLEMKHRSRHMQTSRLRWHVLRAR